MVDVATTLPTGGQLKHIAYTTNCTLEDATRIAQAFGPGDPPYPMPIAYLKEFEAASANDIVCKTDRLLQPKLHQLQELLHDVCGVMRIWTPQRVAEITSKVMADYFDKKHSLAASAEVAKHATLGFLFDMPELPAHGLLRFHIRCKRTAPCTAMHTLTASFF